MYKVSFCSRLRFSALLQNENKMAVGMRHMPNRGFLGDTVAATHCSPPCSKVFVRFPAWNEDIPATHSSAPTLMPMDDCPPVAGGSKPLLPGTYLELQVVGCAEHRQQ